MSVWETFISEWLTNTLEQKCYSNSQYAKTSVINNYIDGLGFTYMAATSSESSKGNSRDFLSPVIGCKNCLWNKGGLISESFSFRLQSFQKGAKSLQSWAVHYPLKEKMLRTVYVGTFFGRWEPKWKTFWD